MSRRNKSTTKNYSNIQVYLRIESIDYPQLEKTSCKYCKCDYRIRSWRKKFDDNDHQAHTHTWWWWLSCLMSQIQIIQSSNQKLLHIACACSLALHETNSLHLIPKTFNSQIIQLNVIFSCLIKFPWLRHKKKLAKLWNLFYFAGDLFFLKLLSLWLIKKKKKKII